MFNRMRELISSALVLVS